MAITAKTDPARPAATSSTAIPSILAVVVTHRGRRWLTDCLVGLNVQTYPYLDVLVVDDASPPDEGPSLKRVAKRHIRRRRWGYLRTPRSLGFGGAINWALSRVRTKADLLLFIHDDCALEPDAVERMVARLVADETTAIVGPKLVSWDDPERLEEVGMAADRFGYPYKGLEEGELDLGQHDASREVFFVTSTCMLIRHETFRLLRGWDARMRAFSEDLDLCWRARLRGFSIRVEPLARARHAIALARGNRQSRYVPARYFSRRNRLRTVAKNASGVRLLALIPQFLLLTIVEAVGFAVLRQPREILHLARAFGWNLVALPQTLSERARVQRHRKVTDRGLRRLTVRQTTRVRAYIGQKLERFGEAWGSRAELIARQTNVVREVARRLRGWTAVATILLAIGILLGFRHFLWAPPVAFGDLLPYPDRATAMWRAFASPWQGAGLGYPGPAPPAFVFLGIFPVVALGAAGAAQKLLIITLGLAAFAGAYQLVSEVVDRPGRFAAGIAYALGSVGYAALRTGELDALVFGASAPFMLHFLLRLTGWVRPPGWSRGRAAARVAVVAALSAAFVPGTIVLYAVVALVLACSRAVLDRSGVPLRGLVSAAIGLAFAWALLLPWSASWFTQGGVFELLWDRTSPAFTSAYASHEMASVLLGQTPDGPELFGLALPLLGIVAVFAGEGQRRRLALAMWAVVATAGFAVSLASAGIAPPVVATPTEAGVLASAGFAGLAGLAVGVFRLDLVRRGLGWVHAIAIAGFAVAMFLAVAGLAPALWHGEWAPAAPKAAAVEQVRSLLEAEADAEGQFRVLWVGSEWSPDAATATRPPTHYFVTGARGRVLTDLFERSAPDASIELARVVASIEEGSTDRGGRLLGAFNIRYVALTPSSAHEWLTQRDLSLTRDDEEHRYLLLENPQTLDRAAVYRELPVYVSAIEQRDPSLTSAVRDLPRAVAVQLAPSRYVAEEVEGPGTAFLADAQDDAWTASVGGLTLDRTEGGWGNAFAVPAGARGDLRLSHPRPISQLAWLLVIGLAWIAALGAAFSRDTNPLEPEARA